jgi:hypothetical protein
MSLYIAGSKFKEDAAAGGLRKDVKLAVMVRTGWRHIVSVAYFTHCQLYPQGHGAKTEASLHA